MTALGSTIIRTLGGFQMPKSDAEGLYQVPLDYEALWGAPGDDWPWYRAQVLNAPRVLDLATGTGRLALLVAGLGAQVCAIDSSEAMLAVARARGADTGLPVDWRRADLRCLDLGRVFDLAILPYNGLQHLCDAEDLDGFFHGLKRSLAEDGRFALDLHLPRPEILARDPEEWFGVEDSGTSPTGWRVLAEQSRWNPASQVLTQRWKLGNRGGDERTVALPLRQFFPQELRRLLQQAGFRVLGHWGGFQGQHLDAASLKQVILASLIA
jgi:SAM-dependent methyltransferase